MKKVLIKGAGEHASGTAHRLFRCGFDVVMTELERPTAVRRRVSFCSAVYDGECVVEGVRALRHERLGPHADHIPVLVDPACEVRHTWRPDVIIDGRILKRNHDNHIDDAPLTIGFGPGLVAGVDVHVVIETMRGHDLGRLITQGTASENTGVPGTIGGQSQHRVLRAPAAGVFRGDTVIGSHVDVGDELGSVAGVPVLAKIHGVVRGLIHSGAEVPEGFKIGDVDPRDDPTYCSTISDKARNLSGSALEAILSWKG